METASVRRPGYRTFVQRYKTTIGVIAILAGFYYWNALRPAHIDTICSVEASANARVLLHQKAETTTDQTNRQTYANLAERNMYLRSDYEAYYKKCLRGYGIFEG